MSFVRQSDGIWRTTTSPPPARKRPEPWVNGEVFNGVYRVEHSPLDDCRVQGWHLFTDCGIRKGGA